MSGLLITNLQLKSGTPIGGNVDVDSYRTIIEEVQVFTIEPILGTKLYKKLINDIDLGLIGVYETIHETYLIPIIRYSVAAEFIIMAPYVVGNSGVFKRAPENSETVKKYEVDSLANKQRAKADVYIERLIKYLKDERSNIPEYTFNQDQTFDIKPENDVDTFLNWSLDKYRDNSTDSEIEIMKDIRYDNGQR